MPSRDEFAIVAILAEAGIDEAGNTDMIGRLVDYVTDVRAEKRLNTPPPIPPFPSPIPSITMPDGNVWQVTRWTSMPPSTITMTLGECLS